MNHHPHGPMSVEEGASLNWYQRRDPLPMPAQDLNRDVHYRQPKLPTKPATRVTLLLVILLTLAATGLFTYGLYQALALQNGGTPIHHVFLAVSALLFSWIAFGAANAVAGAVAVLTGRGRDTIRLPDASVPLATRTALLFPIYHEDPGQIARRIRSLDNELRALGVERHFAFFVLSDSRRDAAREAEMEIFSLLARSGEIAAGLSYRNRRDNVAKKAGNIQDWVETHGGGYNHFVIFDADSAMSGQLLCRLAGAMERHHRTGLIQTVPRLVNPSTLFAAMNAFANNVYGPVFAAGFASWQGPTGNYWGHNAIIRTRAFAASAGLPELPGRPPIGGHIQSHDFVEAALLRRAGWRIDLVTSVTDTNEEGPPTVIDMAVRDRRWMQGNLQHLAVLRARGLAPVSRVHLAFGIVAYLSSALWALMLCLGVWLTLVEQTRVPDYFPEGKTLFPNWPTFDPDAGLRVLYGTIVVLLLPKVLALGVHLVRQRAGAVRAIKTVLRSIAETLASALLAPVMMLIHVRGLLEIVAGLDSGWSSQRRMAERVPLATALRFHALHVVAGTVLLAIASAGSLEAVLWLSPVIAGLILSPVFTWVSSYGVSRSR